MDRSLRRAVLERLAAVEEIALRAGSQLSVRLTRSHLKIITGGWRELLLEHQPDLKGRCPVCSGWLRRRRWPCQVWVTAHRHLIGGEGPEPARWPARKPNLFRRPRQVEVVPRQTAAPSAADQTGADAGLLGSNRTRHGGINRTGHDGINRTEYGGDERFTAEQPAIGPLSADTGEIHRAAISERAPTLPRSRRNWRSRH